jgi:hypothetical protein
MKAHRIAWFALLALAACASESSMSAFSPTTTGKPQGEPENTTASPSNVTGQTAAAVVTPLQATTGVQTTSSTTRGTNSEAASDGTSPSSLRSNKGSPGVQPSGGTPRPSNTGDPCGTNCR